MTPPGLRALTLPGLRALTRPELSTLWTGILAGAALPCLGQPLPEALTGSVSLGVRSVDVSGTETKFREDVNLESGVRLFDVSLSYAPSGDGERPVDRIELNASHLGGDPFESIHFGVRKYGAYDLKLDRRRSAYFYEDTILPAALASVTGSTGGDFHHFDFERIRDTVALNMNLSPATKLSLGLERQTRKGESSTTLNVERDEFELDQPLAESLDAFRFGIQHAWDKVTLIVDEELRDFENTRELFLPGASSGRNTADMAELLFFRLDQSYDYQSRGHALRVLADPTSRLNIQGAWQREDLDLGMRASEEASGTGFSGAPFDTTASGPAQIGRDIEQSALDFALTLGDRVRLVGGARTSTLEQSGLLVFGSDQGAGDWHIETDGVELGIEVAARANLALAAGWSTETRDMAYDRVSNGVTVSERESTDRAGYFARLLFTTGRGVEVTASVEDNSIDDAFALASPTASTRYRLAVKRRWENGVSVTASHRRTDVENRPSGWAADTEQTDLRMSYRSDRLEVTVGLGEVELTRGADRLVTAGTRQDLFLINYDADADFTNASVRWLANDRWSLGGSLGAYDNGGSFPLQRNDLRVYADVALGASYTLELSYRDLDYTEDAFDAYDAELLEMAVRLQW